MSPITWRKENLPARNACTNSVRKLNMLFCWVEHHRLPDLGRLVIMVIITILIIIYIILITNSTQISMSKTRVHEHFKSVSKLNWNRSILILPLSWFPNSFKCSVLKVEHLCSRLSTILSSFRTYKINDSSNSWLTLTWPPVQFPISVGHAGVPNTNMADRMLTT